MRGHGNTVVGPDIRETVARAIYTEVNARAPAGSSEWGAPSSISTPAGEAQEMARAMNVGPGHGVDRVWQMWLDEVKLRSPIQS